MPLGPRNRDFESDSFAFNSEELEAIIRGSTGAGPACDDPPPFEESSASFTENNAEDPSLRMSFARWTPEDKKSWTCAICTFVNEPLHLTCGVCGKAKGAKAGDDTASNNSSVAEAQDLQFDDDYFMEQLRNERHNEVLELQESILGAAAMELSLRDHSARDTSARSTSARDNSQRTDYTQSYGANTGQTTGFASARPQSPPTATASRPPVRSSPPPSPRHVPAQHARPGESAVYASVSDAEEAELRKILAMSASATCHSTQSSSSNRVDAMSYSSPSNLSSNGPPSRDQRRRPQRQLGSISEGQIPTPNFTRRHSPSGQIPSSAGEDTEDDQKRSSMSSVDSMDDSSYSYGHHGMSSSTPAAARSTLSAEHRRMCTSNMTGADQRRTRMEDTARPGSSPDHGDVDRDLLEKIAARSQGRTNNYDDMPGLTSMAQAPAAPPAATIPGAYQNRPGATPVRNDSSAWTKKAASASLATAGSTSRQSSLREVQATTTTAEPDSKPSAEEAKIRKEDDEQQKPSTKSPKGRFAAFRSPAALATGRASSGVALDDDMLQMIVNGADEQPPPAAAASSKPSSKSSPKASRADMLQKAWKANEETESTKKGKEGKLKKAAKGFMKNRMPFRKKS